MVDLDNNTIHGKHSYLLEYLNKIKSGEIIAGQELIQQLENLLQDLGSPDYIFDNTDSEFRIMFIEKFCKHTKSPFFGEPFLLELFQKALIEAAYSFKCSETKLRRFKKVILLISRKGGKTTLCAGLSNSEFFCGNGGADIVCSSNDDAQASIIFDEINSMREWSPALKKRSHKNQKGIFNLKNKSTVKKLSDRTRNKEGRNIDFAILDEVHEMKTNIIGKSIEQSQSTKDEPMLIMITTEGFVNDGYLDAELKYARKVLNGEIEDPTLLTWLYTQDSENEIWQDEKSWYKSNPSLGVVKKVSYLRDQLRKAQQDKAERVFTLAKDFNLKQNNATAWLAENEFINEATYKLEDFKNCVGLAAVDLSETTDLCCAKVLVMRKNDNKKYIITKYFIPEAKVVDGSVEDKKNYLEWARQGLIEVCPGNENDYSLITNWFVSLYKQYGIRIFKTGYDNWNAKYWIKEMEDIGFDTEKVGMDYNNLSNPMKLVEADLRSKLINYNNNPITRWNLGNTALKVNNLGQIMPVKVNDLQNRRIDGAVTLIILYAIYQRYKTEYLEMVR
ncbi:terminase large subunit [Bacillus sp. FJAT-45350]|uniref:terminase large subunit n=1 Tax=Bacillus sp. FJAT-45350 TaxID=2011014 RepID=UPI000BB77B17|nr:terminase TerL endonuclease subunit [Bacillus sp. FJAT-45350]